VRGGRGEDPLRDAQAARGRAVRLVSLVLAAVAAGCGGPRAQNGASPTPAASPRTFRVAVVDLERVAREHPRAQELEALRRRIQQTEAALAVPLPPPVLPSPAPLQRVTARIREDAQRMLQDQAQALRETYRRELAAMQRQARAELEAYGRQLQAEAQQALKARQDQVQEELRRRVEARQQETQTRVRAHEEQVAQEYRLPLLNLRLKLETVQHADRQQYDRLLQEYERLQRERDAKIQAFADQEQRALREFAQQEEQRAREALEAYRKELEAQTRARLQEREAAVRARLEEAARERERRFQQAMRARQEELQRQAARQAQEAAERVRSELERVARAAQERYLQEERARQEQLRQQLAALRTQQADLEATILAEVRVEVAQVALERGLDLVLVRYVSHQNATDITDAVLRRLREKR